MEYNFRKIEEKWQKFWKENNIYKVDIDTNKPKYYVLDMFPYPSGAGLHVGHPLGYIASDIYSRYKRLTGFNVLHPMGFDAFGLPAEQYAVQTGQHPAVTTEQNIKRYHEQLDKIGFSYDWSREVRTCDPDYYKWTQWAFIQMFRHWYNNRTQKAESIDDLIKEFEKNGNAGIDAACNPTEIFTEKDWKSKSEKEKQELLLNYRLAYLADTLVNWCPELRCVLANDEVVNGVSVRGGYPVEQQKMRQWSLRISAYAQRLLDDLEKIDWTESLKEIQRNWIGRSEGAELKFKIKNSDQKIEVFTTRPDTIFGATFMVLAPESEIVKEIATSDYKKEVEKYIAETKKRTERERMADAKTVSGQFTGAFAINPFTKKEMMIYIADYVLSGYGTGAIMAVPGHDSRDFRFARHFNLPIIQVVAEKGKEPSDTADWDDAYEAKEGIMINSDFINGMDVNKAITATLDKIEKMGIGKRKINFRLRDAIFSRQRYWGEPFPVYYMDGIPCVMNDDELPLVLPAVDKYLPTNDGLPPLGRAENWHTKEGFPYEYNTMPGFAGSSAYYYRYMDPKNDKMLVSKEAVEYWQDVDLYIGGTEHATGHLVYARFWNKFLFDLGYVVKDEPFKKLINQGMIQGVSEKVFVYSSKHGGESLTNTIHLFNEFGKITDISIDKPRRVLISADIYSKFFQNSQIYVYNPINIDIQHIKEKGTDSSYLDISSFLKDEKYREFSDAVFITNDGGFWIKNQYYNSGGNLINNSLSRNFKTKSEIEKMSKSKYNVVNPDDIVDKYGADTLRMYEMFLGPIEQSKPWDTNGIEGVYKFFRKLWRLFYDEKGTLLLSEDEPTKDELRILHKTIKKIRQDIENFSFNTSVSAFMICVNELTEQKCHKREILKPLVITLSPFAPHIAEELWEILGEKESVINASFPDFNESFLEVSSFNYPVSFNGKVRFFIDLPIEITKEEAEKTVISDNRTQQYLEGKTLKKTIFVPRKIINIVI
ncbi:MAG: class I tRNA ligase family protein [Bacteroidota bacterium]